MGCSQSRQQDASAKPQSTRRRSRSAGDRERLHAAAAACLEAARRGSLDGLSLALQRLTPADVAELPSTDSRMYHPLHEAAIGGFQACIELLITSGADPNCQDYAKRTALHYAATDGHRGCVMALIGNGADKDAKDMYGRTPLHCAARHGHLDLCRTLVDAGADVHAVDAHGWSPDRAAAFTGRHECATWLKLQKFASTPAGLACAAAKAGNVEALRAALEGLTKEEVAQLPKITRTPLHSAAAHGHRECVDILLAAGADVHAKDSDLGSTALHLAAAIGHLTCVEALLTAGASVAAINSEGWTPLLWAADEGTTPCVELLLAHGADPTAINNEGWTPLHLSCDKGHKTCADALVAAGSDVNACDEGRPTPLHLTPLHLASMNGHSRCIRSLLGAGAVPDAKDSWGKTPAHMAAHRGHTRCLEALLEGGAEACPTDDDGTTPLHLAAMGGHAACARVLLSGGATVDAIDQHSATALHYSALHGHLSCVRMLLAANADVDRETASGRTALQLAAEKGHTDCIELLSAAGAHLHGTIYERPSDDEGSAAASPAPAFHPPPSIKAQRSSGDDCTQATPRSAELQRTPMARGHRTLLEDDSASAQLASIKADSAAASAAIAGGVVRRVGTDVDRFSPTLMVDSGPDSADEDGDSMSGIMYGAGVDRQQTIVTLSDREDTPVSANDALGPSPLPLEAGRVRRRHGRNGSDGSASSSTCSSERKVGRRRRGKDRTMARSATEAAAAAVTEAGSDADGSNGTKVGAVGVATATTTAAASGVPPVANPDYRFYVSAASSLSSDARADSPSGTAGHGLSVDTLVGAGADSSRDFHF